MLTAEEKRECKSIAEALCSNDPKMYFYLRNTMREKWNAKEAEVFMTILFHLLPQSSKDHVATALMSEALDANKN